MIARMWLGERPQNADTYENLLRDESSLACDAIPGFEGAYLLRPAAAGEVEFVTVDNVYVARCGEQFAGEDYETAVLHPQAVPLLSRYDRNRVHYENANHARVKSAGCVSSKRTTSDDRLTTV